MNCSESGTQDWRTTSTPKKACGTTTYNLSTITSTTMVFLNIFYFKISSTYYCREGKESERSELAVAGPVVLLGEVGIYEWF